MQPARWLSIPYSLSSVFSIGPQLWKVSAEALASGSSGSRNESWANLGIETSDTCLLQVCSFSSRDSQSNSILAAILTWFWATSCVLMLVLYSYFLLTVPSKPKRDQTLILMMECKILIWQKNPFYYYLLMLFIIIGISCQIPSCWFLSPLLSILPTLAELPVCCLSQAGWNTWVFVLHSCTHATAQPSAECSIWQFLL